MGDEQSGSYEDTPREDVSSPEIDPRFGTGSEQSLFDRFLSGNVLQDQDGSALDFNYTNFAPIKTVLQHCAQIHSCAHCSTRSDHMILAAVVVNKNVSLLQKVFEVYTQRCAASSKAADGEDAGEQPSLHHANAHQQPLQRRSSCYHLFVNDYVVNSADEWAAVIKPLIEILSRHTLDLLNG